MIAALSPAKDLSVPEVRRQLDGLREVVQGGLGLGSGGKASRGQQVCGECVWGGGCEVKRQLDGLREVVQGGLGLGSGGKASRGQQVRSLGHAARGGGGEGGGRGMVPGVGVGLVWVESWRDLREVVQV